MPNNKLKKQLISLCTGELAASIMFVLVLLLFKHEQLISLRYVIVYPFFCLILVLLQGSYYWLYCLNKINHRKISESGFRRLYGVFRKVDLALIALCPLIIIYDFYVTDFIIDSETVLGLFLFLFAVVEYINYFYIRLSYSRIADIFSCITLKNVRKSSLNKELGKAKK